METAFCLLLVAFVGAITTLAYQQPSQYRNLALWLLLGMGTCWIGAMLYAFGYQRGALDASRFLQDNPKGWFEGGAFPFDGMIATAIVYAVFLYIYLLVYLPNILGLNSEEQPPKDPD